MYLKELLAESKNFDKDFGMQEVKSISKDCEKPQQVYFCLTNDYSKAKSRALTALQNGATYVISNFDLPFNNSFKVHDVRNVFAHSAKKFYHNACDDMIMIGICGTNGKTSTSHIIGQMLKHQNKKVGILGTSGVYYNGKSFDCPLTTPDADFLHKTFLEMKNDGVEYVVMEVSAHAIEQKRINGINFDIGVLTNITQDHLDYFKTMQDYEKTKLSFFSPEHVKRAIVCADDERAKKLIDICQVPLYTYGLDSYCDYMAKKVNCSLNGSNYISKIYGEEFQAKTNLIGRYNVYNSLAAIAVGNVLGFKNKDLIDSLKYVEPVEGRFNVIKINGKYAVIDYAHSPDGIYNVLRAAKELCEGNIYVVFGCGGNRDAIKRPQMGSIAENYADFVCLTDDNPRCENSLDIISDIEKGMKKPHVVQPDRKKAIFFALDSAKEGDLVIIAGKGAEKYQEIGKIKYPYNDFDVVYEYKTKTLSQNNIKEK